MTTSAEWSDSSLSEANTRAKLIDPALRARGWTEDLIRREETAGTIGIIGGKARRRARGQVDYTLRLKIAVAAQPVAVALIEAKKKACRPAMVSIRPKPTRRVNGSTCPSSFLPTAINSSNTTVSPD